MDTNNVLAKKGAIGPHKREMNPLQAYQPVAYEILLILLKCIRHQHQVGRQRPDNRVTAMIRFGSEVLHRHAPALGIPPFKGDYPVQLAVESCRFVPNGDQASEG